MISREKLIQLLNQKKAEYSNSNYKQIRRGLCKAISIAYDMPTIDAVEVVRCKDCVWYQPNWIMGQDVCGKIMHNALRVSPNFFCQRGEREEDNNGKDN